MWYYNPQLVTGIVLGYVTIKEYTFFVLETLFAGLRWWLLTRRINLKGRNLFHPKKFASARSLFFLYSGSYFTILFFAGPPSHTYLGIARYRPATSLWRGYPLVSLQTRSVDHSPNDALPLRRWFTRHYCLNMDNCARSIHGYFARWRFAHRRGNIFSSYRGTGHIWGVLIPRKGSTRSNARMGSKIENQELITKLIN